MTPPFTAVFTQETLVVTSGNGDTHIIFRHSDAGRFDATVRAMTSIIQLCGEPEPRHAGAQPMQPVPVPWIGAIPTDDEVEPLAETEQADPAEYRQGFSDGLCEVGDLLADDPDMPFVEWTGDMTLYDAGWYAGWCKGFQEIKGWVGTADPEFDEDVALARALLDTQQDAPPPSCEPQDIVGDAAMDEYTRFILAAAHDAGVLDISPDAAPLRQG